GGRGVRDEAQRHLPAADDGSRFALYSGETSAENAPTPEAQPYEAVFANTTGMLTPGASVTLAGKRVGEVSAASLDYDADAGKLLLHATLMLEPGRMRIEHGSGTAREQMNTMLERLIGQGLRAGLESSPPVVGSRQVALRFVPNAPPTVLGSGPRPEIPTTSGAGVDSIMAQASDVMAKIDSLPLNQIADNLQQTTQRLAELSQSPETKEALQNVNDAIANVRRVSTSMSRDLPAALSRMTRAIQSAQAMIGQEGEVANQPQTSTLPSTLFEVRQAARSIRELANELDRNPQALLTGK
ncbi:MAG TPA: MlaD family protein, partial [Rhodopila sp.]|nr:MlaD family protein [Rhodopila sp.]